LAKKIKSKTNSTCGTKQSLDFLIFNLFNMIKFSPKAHESVELKPMQILQTILNRAEKTMDSIEKSRNPKDQMLYDALKEVQRVTKIEMDKAKTKLNGKLISES